MKPRSWNTRTNSWHRPRRKKKKSKLEEAAAKAAGEGTEAPEDGGEVLEAGGEFNSLEDGESLEISAEDDFEEFDPA
mgnify:CR=1 FL=1